jgi:hypothetical protein
MAKILRELQDALLTANVALPNAANTVNTAGIDLGVTQPYPTTEAFQVRLATSVATGANSKNINVIVQDSADNVTFANIAGIASVAHAGNSANHIAANTNFSLPPATRRYIRGSATGEANGGDSSDGTLTISLRF